MKTVGTFWSLVPSLLAIVLGITTKDVNLSLIIGIMVGVLLFCGFAPLESLQTFIQVIQENVIGNFGNLLFAVLLGMFIYLITHSGASQRYGEWAQRRIKTRRAGMFATFGLGVLIFVDDYFNCLSVGTVMRPLTDRLKISREKLAYIIDTTAAPVCIIAPVSSWAAGVASSLPKDSDIDGFQLFLRTIFCNYYALISLAMVFLIILLQMDYGAMRGYEADALAGKAPVTMSEQEEEVTEVPERVTVFDLLGPILVLIICTVFFMAYTGGILNGMSVIDAFANCDAITACCMGTLVADLFLLLLYVPRGIFTFRGYMNALVEGFRYMAPAMLLLGLAWTIGGICGSDYLNTGSFISGVVEQFHVPMTVMPVFFFVAAILLSFSTGTSWGTFMILIPMEVAVFSGVQSDLMVLTTAAVLGGSVCGDHLSPISDTTILSSTGAGCQHIRHVRSQLPYGALAASVSLAGYIVSGFTGNGWLGLGCALLLLLGALSVIRAAQGKRAVA